MTLSAFAEEDSPQAFDGLAQRETKEAALQRVQAIQQQLNDKSDARWVEQNITGPLQQLQDYAHRHEEAEAMLQKLLSDQSELSNQVSDIHTGVDTAHSHASTLRTVLEQVMEKLDKKADILYVETKSKTSSLKLSKDLDERAARAETQVKLLSAYMADMRQQVRVCPLEPNPVSFNCELPLFGSPLTVQM